jgi:hypothetical protein
MDPFTFAAAAGAAATTTAQTLGLIEKVLKTPGGNQSLVGLSKGTRVEPICIIGQDCVHLEYITDVLQSLHSIFSGYYLQALSAITNVGDIQVGHILQRINPNTNLLNNEGFIFESYDNSNVIKNNAPYWRLATESYKYKLPTSKNFTQDDVRDIYVRRNLAVEAANNEDDRGYLSRDQLDEQHGFKTDENTLAWHAHQRAENDESRKNDSNRRAERDEARKDDANKRGWNQDTRADKDSTLREKEYDLHKSANDRAHFKEFGSDDGSLLGDTQIKNRKEGRDQEKHTTDQAKAFGLDSYEKDDKGNFKLDDKGNKILKHHYLGDIEARDSKERRERAEFDSSNVDISDNAVRTLQENADLSVGKLINVTIQHQANKINLPISIRLLVSQLPEKSIVDILTMHSRSTSFTERFHAWKAGRISFVKDLMFCQDLIDAHKKALMNDKDGVLSEMVYRSNSAKGLNLLSLVFNGAKNSKINMASASNLYVISESTRDAIESKLGGKLSSVSVREKLFTSGYMMILCIIDRTWERITFYHRGLHLPTTVSLKDIRISNKGKGPDIGDILKAYSLGSSPQF